MGIHVIIYLALNSEHLFLFWHSALCNTNELEEVLVETHETCNERINSSPSFTKS